MSNLVSFVGTNRDFDVVLGHMVRLCSDKHSGNFSRKTGGDVLLGAGPRAWKDDCIYIKA
jgi:hypothetical protein